MRDSCNYCIVVEEQLDKKWERWFGEIEMELLSNGNTKLTVHFCDQAKLYAILNRIRDIGLRLVSLEKYYN